MKCRSWTAQYALGFMLLLAETCALTTTAAESVGPHRKASRPVNPLRSPTTPLEPYGIKPEIRVVVIPINMYVRWFFTMAGIKEKSVCIIIEPGPFSPFPLFPLFPLIPPLSSNRLLGCHNQIAAGSRRKVTDHRGFNVDLRTHYGLVWLNRQLTLSAARALEQPER